MVLSLSFWTAQALELALVRLGSLEPKHLPSFGRL